MTKARRKTPNGVEPAHLNAPPRLRQSHIAEPFKLLPIEEGGFWGKLSWIRLPRFRGGRW